MSKKAGRYSYIIRPLTTCIDLITINVMAQVWFSTLTEQHYLFHLVLSLGWLIAAGLSDYYEVYRHTKTVHVAKKGKDSFNPQVIELVRKGIIGDWRNHFTQEQSRRMDEWIARRTKGTDVMDLWKGLDV